MIKNIVSNYFGKLLVILFNYLFIPFYIKTLGIESYGIINFYTILTGLLLFADAGLTATINREFSKNSDISYLRNLLYSIEIIYGFFIVLFLIVLFFLSPFIANNWLNHSHFSTEKLIFFIRLMGISMTFQFFSTLHNGGLNGLQKQPLSNLIQVIWTLFKSGLIIFILKYSPNLDTYFIWQIISNCLFFFLFRWQLWKQIEGKTTAIFNIEILKQLTSFAFGMMFISIISSINTQIDKLMIGNLLNLKDFTYYSLSSLISQVPLVLITPITIAIFPILVQQIQKKEFFKLVYNFHLFAFLISFISSFICFSIFFYVEDFAPFWINNPLIIKNIPTITKYLCIGTLFLCGQVMPYTLAIANGHTKTNLFLGIFSILFTTGTIFFFIQKWGLQGATIPWIIINILGFIYLGIRIIHKYMKGEFFYWILFDCLFPSTLNFSILYIIHFYTININSFNRLFFIWPLTLVVSIILNFLFIKYKFDISF